MEYVLKKTIEIPGFIIRVHSPTITDEEHSRRMKEIHKAAENLLKKVPKNETRKETYIRTTDTYEGMAH